MMNQRTFEIRFQKLQGIPALLALGAMAVLIIGIIALLVVVGMVVIAVGVAASVGAVLWYAVRRMLTGSVPQRSFQFGDRSASSSSLEVQDIEVEVLPANNDPARLR
jgi:hypothetical protein